MRVLRVHVAVVGDSMSLELRVLMIFLSTVTSVLGNQKISYLDSQFNLLLHPWFDLVLNYPLFSFYSL